MDADENLRRWVLLVAGVAILVLLALAGAANYLDAGGGGAAEPPNVTTVQPVPNGSELWPYTSRSRSVDGRTLAINVIAVGPGDRVSAEFRRQVEANWTTRPYRNASLDEGARANATEPVLEVTAEEVVWLPAHGARRYAYVRGPGGEDRWLAESYQLYDGTYLGARHHVRAYDSPYDRWTAMQAHREYWDWFRLRHTVTSIADTQEYVDAQFLADERIEDVYKVHLRNGDSADGNGWATVIEFAALALLLGGAGRLGRLDGLLARARARLTAARIRSLGRLGVLVGVVAGLYLGVRVGGVALEVGFPGLSPKVIAGALYPVLALGLPIAAYGAARRLRPEDAFVGSITGFLGAFVLEYGYLGLEVIPVSLLLHRVALVLALGLVATGGALSRTAAPGWRRLLALGVAGWVVTLGLPLLGLV